MRFQHKEVESQNYWHLICYPDGNNDENLYEWIRTNCPDVDIVWRFNSGDPFWSIKGDNPKDETFILLKWND